MESVFWDNKNVEILKSMKGRPIQRAGVIYMGKVVKNTLFTILFLCLLTSTAILTYVHFFASRESDLSGKWVAKLDMTEWAAVRALSWLQDIEAVSVSIEDIETYMQDLTIEIDLDLEQTAHSEGTFRCYVLPESYDVCIQSAYDAFAAAFRDLLAERLRMAGYTGSTDDDAVEALVKETFGWSTVYYLLYCSPDLLPPLEDLQVQYNGSGTYEIKGDTLIRQFDAGESVTEKTQRYIREGSNLILFEETDADQYSMIYILQQSSNE